MNTTDFYYHGLKMSREMYKESFENATNTMNSLVCNIKERMGAPLQEGQSITTFIQIPGDNYLIMDINNNDWNAGVYNIPSGSFTYCPVDTLSKDLTVAGRVTLINRFESAHETIKNGLALSGRISSLSREFDKKWNNYKDSIPQELNYSYTIDLGTFNLDASDEIDLNKDSYTTEPELNAINYMESKEDSIYEEGSDTVSQDFDAIDINDDDYVYESDDFER